MTVSSTPVRKNLNRLRRGSLLDSQTPDLAAGMARVLQTIRFRRRDRSLMTDPSERWHARVNPGVLPTVGS